MISYFTLSFSTSSASISFEIQNNQTYNFQRPQKPETIPEQNSAPTKSSWHIQHKSVSSLRIAALATRRWREQENRLNSRYIS